MTPNTIIRCRNCQQRLRIPPGLGGIQITCPKCKSRWEEAGGQVPGPSVLDELLSRWSKEFAQGRDIPAEQLACDRPEILEELASCIAHLKNSKLNGDLRSGENQRSGPWRRGDEPLPGYRLIALLGKGGFGEVWSVGDPARPGFPKYALKIVTGGGHLRSELEGLDQMERAKHPHVLHIHSHSVVGNSLFIITEIAETSLDRYFEKLRTICSLLSLCDRAVNLLYGVAEALDYLQAEKLTHQDIKPANLLLVDGRCKLGDFGAVRPLIRSVEKNEEDNSTDCSLEDTPCDRDFHQGATLYTVGGAWTRHYASPERFQRKSSTSSDQYSLAITFCELVADTIPFQMKKEKDQRNEREGGRMNLNFLPESIRLIVRMALSPTPENRFASCVEFISSLRDALLPLLKQPSFTNNYSTGREIGESTSALVQPAMVPILSTSPNPSRSWFGAIAARLLNGLSCFGERLEQLESRIVRLIASIWASTQGWHETMVFLIPIVALALVPAVILIRQWLDRPSHLLSP